MTKTEKAIQEKFSFILNNTSDSTSYVIKNCLINGKPALYEREYVADRPDYTMLRVLSDKEIDFLTKHMNVNKI